MFRLFATGFWGRNAPARCAGNFQSALKEQSKSSGKELKMIQSPKPEAGRQRPNKKPGSFSLPQANQRQKTHQPPKTPAYRDSQAASDLRPSFFDPLLRNPALSPIIPQFSYFEKPFFQNTDGILTVSPAELPIQYAEKLYRNNFTKGSKARSVNPVRHIDWTHKTRSNEKLLSAPLFCLSSPQLFF